MGGGLMQLVAYGAQDIYLTGNPQITFFKVVYRRHTNFAMECVEQTLNGSTTAGSTVTATVSRNGDLVGKMYVTSVGSQTTTNGSGIVATAEVEIGGQRIDKQTAEWMQIWNELSTPESKAVGLKAMMGDVGTVGASGVGMLQVPLQFWFNRNPGLALPLIALQYHEVKVKLTLGATGTGSEDAKLWADYIYLDTDERRRFAQVSHEYLIEQVQETSASASTSQKLNFNHPVKELVWTSASNYTSAKLVLNGHDRFAAQEEEYFQLRQPFDHHTAVPAQNLPTAAYAAARAGTTTYTNITGNTGDSSLLADVTEGIAGVGAPTALEFNGVLVGGSGTAFTDNSTLTASGTTATRFIAVNGGATGSILDGSLAVGDVHLVVIADQGAVAASKSTLAKIVALYKNAAGTIPVDGTGPVKNGETVTLHTDSGTDVTGNQLIIEYDQTVTTTTALADGDTLTILKVADTGCRTSQLTTKINCYSFALKPEEHQPSGTCNFSRIDNAQLTTGEALDAADNVYAVNYNVLRVMSGMGGLAYSN